MLRHNTPGIADGEQAYWINGELRGHWKGLNWCTDKKLQAYALTLESYVTDRWTKNPENVVYIDNVVIASQYIGPDASLLDAHWSSGHDCGLFQHALKTQRGLARQAPPIATRPSR